VRGPVGVISKGESERMIRMAVELEHHLDVDLITRRAELGAPVVDAKQCQPAGGRSHSRCG
jgi:hypothetical protein